VFCGTKDQYQHATEERDRAIAEALNEQIGCAANEALANVARLRPS